MHRQIAILGGVITIFVFFTGIPSLLHLFSSADLENDQAQVLLKSETGNPYTPSKQPEPPKKDSRPEPPKKASRLFTGKGTLIAGEHLENGSGVSFAARKTVMAHIADIKCESWYGCRTLEVDYPRVGIIRLGGEVYEEVASCPAYYKFVRVEGLFSHKYDEKVINYDGEALTRVGQVYCLALDGGRRYAKLTVTGFEHKKYNKYYSYEEVTVKYTIQQNQTRFFR